jgi:hypothetical protein
MKRLRSLLYLAPVLALALLGAVIGVLLGPSLVAHADGGSWSPAGSMRVPRAFATATLLPTGRVLVAGGETTACCSNFTAAAELYDPHTGTWSATGSMSVARGFATATLLSTGQVLVVGGGNNSGDLASAELYDPNTGTWSTTGSLTGATIIHAKIGSPSHLMKLG